MIDVPETPQQSRTDEPARPRPADVLMTEPGKAIDATICVECTTHSSGRGWCNLRVTRRDSGEIVLDPHVAGSCVIVLDETAATALFDLFGEWLG